MLCAHLSPLIIHTGHLTQRSFAVFCLSMATLLTPAAAVRRLSPEQRFKTTRQSRLHFNRFFSSMFTRTVRYATFLYLRFAILSGSRIFIMTATAMQLNAAALYLPPECHTRRRVVRKYIISIRRRARQQD